MEHLSLVLADSPEFNALVAVLSREPRKFPASLNPNVKHTSYLYFFVLLCRCFFPEQLSRYPYCPTVRMKPDQQHCFFHNVLCDDGLNKLAAVSRIVNESPNFKTLNHIVHYLLPIWRIQGLSFMSKLGRCLLVKPHISAS